MTLDSPDSDMIANVMKHGNVREIPEDRAHVKTAHLRLCAYICMRECVDVCVYVCGKRLPPPSQINGGFVKVARVRRWANERVSRTNARRSKRSTLCTMNFVTAQRANAILNENVRGSCKGFAANCNWPKVFGHVPFLQLQSAYISRYGSR